MGVCGLWLMVAVGCGGCFWVVVDGGSELWFIIFILLVCLYYFNVVYVKIKVLMSSVL